MKNLGPLKLIRAKCLDCCCGSHKEVRLCPVDSCPLFMCRFGKNPNRKGIGGNKTMFVEKTCPEIALNKN